MARAAIVLHRCASALACAIVHVPVAIATSILNPNPASALSLHVPVAIAVAFLDPAAAAHAALVNLRSSSAFAGAVVRVAIAVTMPIVYAAPAAHSTLVSFAVAFSFLSRLPVNLLLVHARACISAVSCTSFVLFVGRPLAGLRASLVASFTRTRFRTLRCTPLVLLLSRRAAAVGAVLVPVFTVLIASTLRKGSSTFRHAAALGFCLPGLAVVDTNVALLVRGCTASHARIVLGGDGFALRNAAVLGFFALRVAVGHANVALLLCGLAHVQ